MTIRAGQGMLTEPETRERHISASMPGHMQRKLPAAVTLYHALRRRAVEAGTCTAAAKATPS